MVHMGATFSEVCFRARMTRERIAIFHEHFAVFEAIVLYPNCELLKDRLVVDMVW